MVFSGIGSGNQNHLGLFNITDGVGHRSTAEGCGQTGHSGGMSEAGTVVDIVGFQHRPGEFVGDIILFIADAG